eukprot:SAG11_NODE_307_length_10982_cov_22.068823_13_plen_60_part_00
MPEIYAGAKLFYLSGLVNDLYQNQEVHNLARFISVMKFRPLICALRCVARGVASDAVMN